ncbi:MAG TPA: cache domain-containing protein, partial [Elusimicrobiota bacterium]|nr:cache domain-containing protein [Elusimicrobiota bacterium]
MRVKLAGLLTVVSSAAVLAAGLLTIHYSRRALEAQKQQDELAMARALATQIEEALSKARQTVAELAAEPGIRDLDPAKLAYATTLVVDVTETLDGFFVLDASGKVLAMDRAEPDTRRLFPASTYEQFVAPVIRTSTTTFSGVYRSRSGEPAVAICAPIFRGKRLLGVLAGGILLKEHDLGGIARIRIGRSGYAYIVDQNGAIVAHPQREKLLQNVAYSPPVRALLDRHEGASEFVNADGVPVLSAYSPIGSPPWGVVVRQPAVESYAHADRLYDVLTIVFLGALACAAGLGLSLAWNVSRPILELA